MRTRQSTKLTSSIFRGILLSSGGGFLLFATIVLSLLSQNEEKNLQSHLQLVADAAKGSLEQALWSFDDSLIKVVGNGILDEEIQKVVIKNEQGKVLFEQEDLRSPNPEWRMFTSALKHEGKVIGEIELWASTWKAKERRNLFGLALLLLSTILVFLKTLTTYFIIKKRFLSPLFKIEKMTAEIERGNYSQSWAPIQVIEIDELGRAVESMAQGIKNRDRELHQYSQKLESRVSERTHELEAQRAISLASSRLAELGEVAAGIAHEINSPLTIIQGNAELMEKKLARGALNPESQKDALGKIHRMCLRISKIIRGLRSFARDGKNDPLEIVPVQLILTNMLEIFGGRLTKMGIELKLDIPEQLLYVQGRETQLTQVMGNLLNNARDAVETLPEKWISIKIEYTENSVFFRIIDSGKGIPLDVQKKMMVPFFTTKEVGKGTGLGLSISKGIIDTHNGKLEVDNAYPNTCFVITLPRVTQTEEKKSA